MHAWGYAHGLKSRTDAQAVAVYDADPAMAERFANDFGVERCASPEALLDAADALIVCSENMWHAEYVEVAASRRKPTLCEKPLAPNAEHARRIATAAEASGMLLMTAFPCRFSPAYRRLKERVASDDIGKLRAVCATNRGSCPGGWFVQAEHSGGGAMIDHVVHVADLLHDLLGEEPVRVQAQTGHNMYGETWEDTAMLTLEYPCGVFATLDSSWSRPKSYKTWGDVTMNVVGESGVIEMDMFGWGADLYRNADMRHSHAGYGSNLDALLVDGFLAAVRGEGPAVPSARDGLAAARVALAGYASVAQGGAPVALAI